MDSKRGMTKRTKCTSAVLVPNLLAISTLLLLVMLRLPESGVTATRLNQSDVQIVPQFKLPTALLEWGSYMHFFNKNYSTLAQQLARQKIFISRAMEVFMIGVKYRFHKIGYFLTINKYSDRSQDEVERLLSADDSKPLTLEGSDENQIEAAIKEALEEEELEVKRRRAEETIKQKHRRRRRSTTGSDEEKSKRAVNPNIKWIVPSDNPDYVPIEPTNKNNPEEANNQVMVEQDLSPEQLKEIEQQTGIGEADNSRNAFSMIKSALSGITSWFMAEHRDEFDDYDDEDSVDVVTRDWRHTGCIGPVVDQDLCASCYAVATIGVIEYAFCMSQDRQFTPLSIQYMVDCGKQFKMETNGTMEMNGCESGQSRHSMKFITEYGCELETNMPYMNGESSCPIAFNASRKTKGYIRPNVRKLLGLASDSPRLDLALKKGPVIVIMRAPLNFVNYGGGFIDRCAKSGGHVMVIVGEGVEKGVEYLLIKNSFGEYWGLGGYFKFKKSAAKGCVKSYLVPFIGFPGKKALARRTKAYLANHETSPIINDDLGTEELFN